MTIFRQIESMGRKSVLTRWLMVLALALYAVSSVRVQPVFADDTTQNAIQPLTPGGMSLAVTVADGVAVTTPTQAGASFFKISAAPDTAFALRTSINPYLRRVDTTYSDTIDLTADNTNVTNPTTDTTRSMQRGETATYVLALTNRGNAIDSIGLVVDSAVVDGYTGLDTMPNWSVLFFDSRGVEFGKVLTRGRDTFYLKLAAGKAETLTIKAYADSAAFESSTILFTLRTYVGNANPRQFAIKAYRGLNGETYGGDGHDSITFFVKLKIPSQLRVSKADTAFAPASLGSGLSDAILTDTQHFIPGAILVRTIWFDNDDTASVDTQIVLDEWIDTRFLKFDTAGVRGLGSFQVAAAKAFKDSDYGNIFVDSAMPRNATGAVQYDVRLQYYTSTGLAPLTVSTQPDSIGRIRWTITKVSGVGGLVGGTNGDAQGSIDAAPIGLGAASDSDMGYVRYAVIIRTDTKATTGPGRPDSGTLVGSNAALAGFDSAYIEPDSNVGARTSFGAPFTTEFLPKVAMTPETLVAQKFQQAFADTFYYAHNIANYGNGVDSVALTGTSALQTSGLTITFYRDIGTIGSFDGFEQKIETVTLSQWRSAADSIDILVAVFVPAGFTGTETAYIRTTSRNLAFYDTAADAFRVVSTAQVIPDTGAPQAVMGVGDSITYQIFLEVPCTQDTITIAFDSGTFQGPVIDSTTVAIDSGCVARSTDSTVIITYDSISGQLTVTFLDLPPSDTYVWQVTVQDADSGVLQTIFTETGTFVVDTVPPVFTDTSAARLFTVDTVLTGSETSVSIRLMDTAVTDTHTGIDSIVITIRDTSGAIVRTDTIDPLTVYQFPFDTAGAYTVQIVAIDMAGNTAALPDSLVVQVPVKRTIDLIAADKFGTKQADDVARGLNAQGCVKVTDISAAAKSTITVTITSDVDLIGISLELDRTDMAKGIFEGCFGFTNGVSNTSAKKIKVRDGSLITATYDADGTGPIVSIGDQITWQGILIQGLDNVRTWPNPFNSITDPEIVFHNLPSDMGMTIEIYNLNAEKLRTLKVGDGIEFAANQNIARWNGRNTRGQLVASGTYVYMVRTSIGTKVGKMTIVH